MSLYAMFKGKGPSGFGYGSTAGEVTDGLDLKGQTILLTGCNSGIGKETLRVLTKRGAHVIAAARSVEKAQAACNDVGGETTPVACELSEPASVQACATQVAAMGRPLDAIVCNAGIMALPKLNQSNGYELQFFTNHIGHFILTTSLVDSLSPTGRVVMVSSDAHHGAYNEGIQFDNLSGENGYRPWGAYGQSKLANILFTKQLAKRLSGSQTANCLHPGVIKTNLTRSMNPVVSVVMSIGAPLVLKSEGQGAATQCYLATNPAVGSVTGEYFSDCNVAKPSRAARDDAMAERLWTESERIVAEVTA